VPGWELEASASGMVGGSEKTRQEESEEEVVGRATKAMEEEGNCQSRATQHACRAKGGLRAPPSATTVPSRQLRDTGSR
jgi:hypothetical protein